MSGSHSSSGTDDEVSLGVGTHASNSTARQDTGGVSSSDVKAAAVAVTPFKLPPRLRDRGAGSGTSRSAARIVAQDAVMLLAQLLFFINHVRRLLDACVCEGQADLLTPLAGYPCAASLRGRIAFLIFQPRGTLRTVLQLPPGELWVPLVTAVMLAQLLALLLLPRRLYASGPRWVCIPLVGLLPKAASLASFLAFPGARLSSYFGTYLPLEGAITLWQQAVYNVSSHATEGGL